MVAETVTWKEVSGEKAAGSTPTQSVTHSFRPSSVLAGVYSRNSLFHLISGPSGGQQILAGYWSWSALC